MQEIKLTNIKKLIILSIEFGKYILNYDTYINIDIDKKKLNVPKHVAVNILESCSMNQKENSSIFHRDIDKRIYYAL